MTYLSLVLAASFDWTGASVAKFFLALLVSAITIVASVRIIQMLIHGEGAKEYLQLAVIIVIAAGIAFNIAILASGGLFGGLLSQIGVHS